MIYVTSPGWARTPPLCEGAVMTPSSAARETPWAEETRWVLAAEETPWSEIPGVQLIGAILGILLLVAAIRALFGKGR